MHYLINIIKGDILFLKNNMADFMELNRETAMRLWNKSFGKSISAHDYSGRKIVKSAYNDRNSEFAWNVDHIFPQCKGGKTNDSNLIVCHILTNDEKADKFPCFTANNQKFEIKKVDNHYEIKNLSEKPTKSQNVDTKKQNELNNKTDFLDSASGIRLFKKLKGIQNKTRFVGTVCIKLKNVTNTAIIDFIEELFDSENISYDVNNNSYYNATTTIFLKNYDMPLKEDINSMLDKCVTLNTYLGCYFTAKKLISGYEIKFRVDVFTEKFDMYLSDQKINKDIQNSSGSLYGLLVESGCSNLLFINKEVVINSYAQEKIKLNNLEYYEYNMIFKNLQKNLEKEVSKG